MLGIRSGFDKRVFKCHVTIPGPEWRKRPIRACSLCQPPHGRPKTPVTYRLQATNRTSNAPKELRYSKETEHLKAEIAALHAERDTLLQLQDALLVKLSAYQDIAPDKVYADALAELQTLKQPKRKVEMRKPDYDTTEEDEMEESTRVDQKERGVSNVKEGDTAVEGNIRELESNILWPKPGEQEAWNRETSKLPHKAAGKRKLPSVEKLENPLHIIHISAEFAPAAKVGGLADVITGLSRAFQEMGHTVETILPYYQCLHEQNLENLQHISDFDVPKGSFLNGCMTQGSLRTSAYSASIDGLAVLLLRPDWSVSNLFQGSGIYAGSYNETEAYLYFCRASLEFIKMSGRQPHILHVHDWQTAAVPMLFWELYHGSGLEKTRLVFTIHNLHSQGECRQEEFAATDVNKALDERTIGHNPERLCLMKGGIVYSNVVTTVSPTYAREATEDGAAGWLKSTLLRPDISEKFEGILNGIDTGLWDPRTDPVLPAPFDFDRLEGKQLCKRFLQKALQMDEVEDKPLVVAITRLVPQKGIHLLRQAVYRTAELEGQFVLLGTGYDSGDFKRMAENEFKDSRAVKLMLMYSDRLAHLLYAAADIVLVPSLFEPCGLTQLVGMRYGAIPVVRSTGGLADTVHDIDEEEGNGYTFEGTDEASLRSALDRALADYQHLAKWQELVIRNMSIDSSWKGSARKYMDLYLRAQEQH